MAGLLGPTLEALDESRLQRVLGTERTSTSSSRATWRAPTDHEQFLSLEHRGWVAVSLVPNAPSPGVVGPDAQEVGRQWIERFERRRLDSDGTGARVHWNVRIGHRGLELIDQSEGTQQHGRLLADAPAQRPPPCSSASVSTRSRHSRAPIGGRTPAAIVETIVDLVDLLASHAVDCAVHSALNPGGTMPDEMPAHRPLQMSRSQMEKEIVDAPNQCIDPHGPPTRQNLSSANKRVRPVGSDD